MHQQPQTDRPGDCTSTIRPTTSSRWDVRSRPRAAADTSSPCGTRSAPVGAAALSRPGALYAALNFSLSPLAYDGSNTTVVFCVVSTFICPSDSNAGPGHQDINDYAASFGTTTDDLYDWDNAGPALDTNLQVPHGSSGLFTFGITYGLRAVAPTGPRTPSRTPSGWWATAAGPITATRTPAAPTEATGS